MEHAQVNTDNADKPTVAIAVMGATGSGKTTFINAASGGSLRIGKSLRSCTSVVQLSPTFPLGGREVILIDTPGFDDTNKSDYDILKMIAAFLATTYEEGQKLTGVIYLHRISDLRMGGIARRNFNMFKELCGEGALKNVAVVTNMWGQVSQDVGKAREFQLMNEEDFFKPVLDKGAQMVRHDNTPQTARAILLHLVQKRPLPLQIQTELVDEKKNIADTAAGAELNREMMEQMKRHQKEMRELQEQMEAAMKAKDEETRAELEMEATKLKTEMTRMKNESDSLVSGYMAEKAELERQIELARQAAEAESAEQQRQVDELYRKLEENRNASNAVREQLQQQLNEARARLNRPRPRGFWGRLAGAVGQVVVWSAVGLGGPGALVLGAFEFFRG